MLANHEHRIYPDHCLVWVGKYRNLKNISHWHFDHEIAVCESGEALISLNQETYTLRKGRCCLRGNPHAAQRLALRALNIWGDLQFNKELIRTKPAGDRKI